jgi:class 3 adenylate cyclase/tetratricopeptide (TPR) repeat protein
VRVCPSCGEDNPDRFRLCGICGAALSEAPAAKEVRKTVTIVFSDLQGSTSLGERLETEALREVMARYFQEMRRVLERHGGTVEKYIGDAVMAVFGLARVHEDDALRATRAAWEMKQALVRLNVEIDARWGVTLTNRTGVNTGEVVAGDPSSGQRLVVGDPVNVAARLEQAAPPTEILIGEPTYRLVRGAVVVEPVEPLPLKGKSELVPAYRLIEVREGETVARNLDAPMVGRDGELRLLVDEFARCVEERTCQLVTILGPAGVGKSRLIAELAASVTEDGRLLRGRCLPYGDGITFWPFAEVVKDAAGITEEDDAAGARAKVAATLSGDDAELVVDRVSAAIGLSPDSFALEETFWAARKLLEILARRRPLVVLFEDIHWAESKFLDMIEHVLGSAEDAPVFLLCSSRPELLEERSTWGEGSRSRSISLEPLSEGQSAEVMRNLLGVTELPAELRSRINEAAEGNPLFVEQMLSMMIDDGFLVRADGGPWTVHGDVASLSVPPTISALLGARLDLLSAEERAVLERASIVGQVFYPAAVRTLATDELRPHVDEALVSLSRKQLVQPTPSTFAHEDAYRFVHLLVRDAAYQGLLKRTRAELHEGFADWMEEAAGIRLMEQQEIVGYHLEQAYLVLGELGPLDEQGERIGARGADHLAAAGRRAFARADTPGAANLLRRAASLLPRGERLRTELMRDLAEVRADAGEFAEAEASLEEATEAAASIGDPVLQADIQLVRLLVRLYSGKEDWTEQVVPEIARAISTFEEAEYHAGLARAWRLAGLVHGTACRWVAAEEAARLAVDHARLAGDHRQEVRNLPSVAICELYGPTPVTEALASCEEVLGQVAGDRRAEAIVRGHLAHLHAMQGRFDLARTLYAESRATLEDLGGTVLAATTSLDSGPVELLAGDPVAAERELRRDYDVLKEMGERYFLSTTAALLAQAVYTQGRYDEAFELSEESKDATAPDDIESQVLWRCVRGKVLVRRGEFAEGESLVREALDLIMRTEEPDVQGHVCRDLAQVLHLQGRTSEAREQLGEALRLHERKGNASAAARVRDRLERPVPEGAAP